MLADWLRECLAHPAQHRLYECGLGATFGCIIFLTRLEACPLVDLWGRQATEGFSSDNAKVSLFLGFLNTQKVGLCWLSVPQSSGPLSSSKAITSGFTIVRLPAACDCAGPARHDRQARACVCSTCSEHSLKTSFRCKNTYAAAQQRNSTEMV